MRYIRREKVMSKTMEKPKCETCIHKRVCRYMPRTLIELPEVEEPFVVELKCTWYHEARTSRGDHE